MSEQDRQTSSDGELTVEKAPSTSVIMGEEEGVDGEIDDTEEAEEAPFFEKNRRKRGLPSSNKNIDSSKDSERHRTSSDHRRHRHHGSSHRVRRGHAGGHSDKDNEHLFGPDIRSGSGRLKQRPDNQAEPMFDSYTAARSSRGSPRSHSRSNSKHSHGYSHHQRSKQTSGDSSDSGELPESHEVSLTHTKDTVNATKRIMKENRDFQKMPGKGEAEDGEILEDGELSDDLEEVVEKYGNDSRKDPVEVSTSKTSNKGENKTEKHEKKKSDHKGKRKHENDTKRKKEKQADVKNLEAENSPAPAWGSGYQGPRKKTSTFNREQRFGAGNKGYQSPPGLYDSPSYSEDSSEESVPKSLMTEGYIDASVAADEKEGIFNHKVSLAKKSKRHFERSDRKRGRNSESKTEGPPKKKSLVDMTMSERPACKFYLEGKCVKGNFCQFNHDVEKPRKMEVCKYHLTVKGCIREKCQYMHENFPCKYYHTGAKCYSGDKCKFSHDPLTEDTRRALEMRVAAEDIIDMENPDYGFEYRSREVHKSSLLGSPPRFRPEVKKIPSLFEIEVHPPGQSPKPSQQNISRPSGFYSETSASPKPGMGLNSTGGPINSPNMGLMNSAGTSNQNNQHGPGGPGLLQVPMRPGSMMNGPPMGNNRPTMMMMGNQQGINTQQQRLGAGPSIQFLGPGQVSNNNQQQQGGNLPPVLNMLGAIIREAAMQKGSVSHNNKMNMVPNIGMNINSIRQNMVPNINNAGPNNIWQENINMGQNNSMVSNSTGNIPANNMGPVNIGQIMMGNMSPNNSLGNMGHNSSMGNIGPNSTLGIVGPNNTMGNIGPNNNMENIASAGVLGCLVGNNTATSQQNIGQEDDNMDVDYRIKPKFDEIKEESQDLHELDKIRQQIQAQIDREDEGECDALENSDEDQKMQIIDEQLTSEGSDDFHDKEDQMDNKVAVEIESDHIAIPEHLPKKQKELFKRIQQQQLLRAKELEKQESLKVTEDAEAKAEVDDWYSSDEDGKSETKPKLTDVLKKLNQETSTAVPGGSSLTLESFNNSSSGNPTAPSSASTFNIMQMINAIKSQSTASTNTSASKLMSENVSQTSNNSSMSQDSQQQQVSSPASPPQSVSSPFVPLSDTLHTGTSSLYLPTLTVDPPVVSALPVKPLVYAIVKISLDVPKPYTQLPRAVNASDPTFKDDPRVKWYLSYLEKQAPKEPQRRESSDAEKLQKQSDPRLKKGPSDPRLAKAGDSPRGDGSRSSDLRLNRAQAQTVPSDPRLARLTGGNLDPRLNRQNSQNNQNGSGFMSNMVGGIGGMIGGQMGGSLNQINGPISNMEPMSSLGFSNNLGGLLNSQVSGGVPFVDDPVRLMQGRGCPLNNAHSMGKMNMMGGSMNQMGGLVNQMGPGPVLLNRMKVPLESGSSLVGIGNSSLMSGAGNSIMRGPVGQQNLLRTDSAFFDPRMNSLSDPRLGSQKQLNDTQCSSDPRLKNRPMALKEQQFNKELGFVGMDSRLDTVNSSKDVGGIDQRTFDNSNEFMSAPGNLRGQGGLHQGPHYLQSDAASFGAPGKFKMSQAMESWSSNTNCKVEDDERLPPTSSSSFVPSPAEYSNEDDKTAPKFDYRNDPRFRRVKRLMGQQKYNMEYSSPLGGEDGRGDSDVKGTHEQFGPGHNSYNSPRPSSRDPRNRNIPSPQLPDKLQDFDQPASPSLTIKDTEPDLKVKDLFRAIDPTASPFC